MTIARAGEIRNAAGVSSAIVSGAVYDAVNAIDGTHQPYLVAPPAEPWYSQDAAAATAAFRVLVGLFPAQQGALQAQYDASLAAIPDGPAKQGGINVGEQAAEAMLTARENDGRYGPFTFDIGDEPGEWRPEVPNFELDPFPWTGNVTPFVVPNVDQFLSDGPNALTSAAYAEDFNEVRRVGSQSSTRRTADQTDAALWWLNGNAVWGSIISTLVQQEHLSTAETARLIAMIGLAGADAGAIACHREKYLRNYWRPITAIRQADTDGNPATVADPNWTPLVPTPPFPDHPSGHTCASGAITTVLQAFFGTDRISFSAFSPTSGTTRSFDRFSDANKEVIDARVWAGIHFRTADTAGSVMGHRIANYMLRHYFQPVQ